MNYSTYTPREAPLFLLAVEPNSAPNPAVVAAGWQDYFSEEMDRAIGLQEDSLAMATRAQSRMAEMLDGDGWLAPALCNAFEITAQAMQCCVEMQRQWLTMLASIAAASPSPMALPVASSHHWATLSGECASQSPAQVRQDEEAYAHSMDIAIGETAA